MEELNNKRNAINYLNATDFIRVILYGVKSFHKRWYKYDVHFEWDGEGKAEMRCYQA